jgi:hypothetical protein
MTKLSEQHTEEAKLKKEHVAAAIIAALVQHGIIPHKHPRQNYIKKESEWKKRRISGLR